MVTPGPRASLWARSSVFFAFILSVESLDLRVGSVRSHAGLDTTQKLKYVTLRDWLDVSLGCMSLCNT
eukprot:1349781-Amorphochlora_amoeboformis.AAC.2